MPAASNDEVVPTTAGDSATPGLTTRNEQARPAARALAAAGPLAARLAAHEPWAALSREVAPAQARPACDGTACWTGKGGGGGAGLAAGSGCGAVPCTNAVVAGAAESGDCDRPPSGWAVDIPSGCGDRPAAAAGVSGGGSATSPLQTCSTPLLAGRSGRVMLELPTAIVPGQGGREPRQAAGGREARQAGSWRERPLSASTSTPQGLSNAEGLHYRGLTQAASLLVTSLVPTCHPPCTCVTGTTVPLSITRLLLS